MTNYNAVLSIINYINNIPESDRVLIIPEGAGLNFLTNRNSNNKYYALIPSNTEIFGNKNIISDIKTNSPEHIIINSKQYTDYGTGEFCSTYGKEICNYISENYNFTGTVGDSVKAFIYQKKS
jgi:hypothetical protein